MTQYTINRYDGTFLTKINEDTIDTSTHLRLVGKNYKGYGELMAENLVNLLENFAGPTPPTHATSGLAVDPLPGQLWFNTATKKILVFDGSSFVGTGVTKIEGGAGTGIQTIDENGAVNPITTEGIIKLDFSLLENVGSIGNNLHFAAYDSNETSPNTHKQISFSQINSNLTFNALKDAPASFTGNGLKFLRVNSAATAIEYVGLSTALQSTLVAGSNINLVASGNQITISSTSPTTFLGLTDTPSSYPSNVGVTTTAFVTPTASGLGVIPFATNSGVEFSNNLYLQNVGGSYPTILTSSIITGAIPVCNTLHTVLRCDFNGIQGEKDLFVVKNRAGLTGWRLGSSGGFVPYISAGDNGTGQVNALSVCEFSGRHVLDISGQRDTTVSDVTPAMLLTNNFNTNGLWIHQYYPTSTPTINNYPLVVDVPSGNRFLVDINGEVYAHGSFHPNGADYAEYFESVTGDDIPVGTTVSLQDEKIKVCEVGEEPIGVIRPKDGNMGVVGNSNWNEWEGKYTTDDFGRKIMVDTLFYRWESPVLPEGSKTNVYRADDLSENFVVPKNAEKITEKAPQLNPNYDPNILYVPRSDRKEWLIVGLLGQIPVLSDQVTSPTWKKLKKISNMVDLWLVR